MKIVSLIMLVSASIFLVACGGEESAPPSTPASAVQEESAGSIVPMPKITGIKFSDSSNEGLYKSGDSIKIVISFSEPVTVDLRKDRPFILLEPGLVDQRAFYIGGSNTKYLTFEYVVQPEDSTVCAGCPKSIVNDRGRHYHYSRLRLGNHKLLLKGNPVIIADYGTITGKSPRQFINADLTFPKIFIPNAEMPLRNSKRILVDHSNPMHWKFHAIAGNAGLCYAPCLPELMPFAGQAEQIFAIDLDEDGDIDAVSANYGAGNILWLENTGKKSFLSHQIPQSGESFHARTIYAADVDSDGDIDIITGGTKELVWFENNGNEKFSKHLINSQHIEHTQVTSEDLDGDGDQDIIVASQGDDSIAWYENNGSQEFTRHYISLSINAAHDVQVIDVDLDHDLDIVSASFLDHKITWHENNGAQKFTEHVIADSATGTTSVYAIDLDKDGDIDVLSDAAAIDAIIWYENDSSQTFTAHYITTNADRAYDVHSLDFDADGDLDILSASSYDNKIAWYENDGKENFTPHLITNQAIGASSLYPADIDKDGDIDVFSTSQRDNSITWYENHH